MNKETGRTVGGEVAGATDIDQLSTRSAVTLREQDEIFRRIGGRIEKRGTCGGYLADYHYGVTLATIAGNNLDNWASGAVIGALCGAAGALLGGPAGAALSVIICETFKQIFVGNIDPGGNETTIGTWDTHPGWLGIEHVALGIVSDYTLDWRDLRKTGSIPGHLGMGPDMNIP